MIGKNLTRIAKLISDRGHCSRRKAEALISEGVVFVDGIKVESPSQKFLEDSEIIVDKKNIPLNIEKPKLWIYYKPVGLITTHDDPQNRPTVFDNLPIKFDKKIISIGRLDINSEGLLLLTDSGEIARYFELPSSNLERIYRVRAFGKFTKEMAIEIEKGVTISGIKYRPGKIIHLKDKQNSQNNWFEISLFEGKNREIRKIFRHFGLEVNRLIRISYGPYRLGELNPGNIVEAEII